MIFCGEILYNRSMGAVQDLEKIDSHIRSGQLLIAKKMLRKLPLKSLSLFEKIRAAGLARRCAAPQLSVKWLFSHVYPGGRLDRDCGASLLLEYGASLISAGALFEGRRILEIASKKNEAQSFLHLAFSYIREWDYLKAEVFLRKYLKEAEIDVYAEIVGKVNLLACLVKTQPNEEETLQLAHEILRHSKERNYKRLYMNALELSVQLHVYRKEFRAAETVLNEVSGVAPHESSPEYLFWMKWKLVLDFHLYKKADALKELIRLAEKFSHGETLRDAQLRWALSKKDIFLFEHVYVGTPHLSFRQQAEIDFEEVFGYKFSLSNRHYFLANCPGFSPRKTIPTESQALNVSDGFFKKALSDNEKEVWVPEYKIRYLPFKLLQLLCEDFYQNKNIVELSSKLYSHSYFHPLHSIQGVFQLIKRLNAHFEEHKSDARIECVDGRYQLRSDKLFFVKESRVVQLDLLQDEWKLLNVISQEPDQFFSRKELELLCREAPRTLSRYLEKLVKAGELRVLGKGPSTRYFKNPEK